MERVGTADVCRAEYVHDGRTVHVVAVRAREDGLAEALGTAAAVAAAVAAPDTVTVDLYLSFPAGSTVDTDSQAARLRKLLAAAALPGSIRRVAVIPSGAEVDLLTFRRADVDGARPYWMASEPDPETFAEDIKFRGLHPMIARRLQMWRLKNFEIRPLRAPGEVHLFDCVARDTPSDERLIAVAEVRDLTPVRDDAGRVVALPEVEHVLVGCLDAIRQARSELPGAHRLEWNRVLLYIWPVVDLPLDELTAVARRLAPLTEGLGLEQIVVSGQLAGPGSEEPVETVMRLGYEPGRGVTVRLTEPPTAPMQPLDDYTRKLIQTRRRGLVYPYELLPLLRGEGGTFVEHDLDDDGRLVPVDRPAGQNQAGVVVGVVSTPTERYPEGLTRVAVLGDATKAMGSITEAECRRLLAAIDLAERMQVPIEWFALSAGAKIAMDSGSENLDWVARVLRRLVEHTQHGGEVNVVVAGINVGAQPYWNAEATMLMHTRGILVMTPDSAMVLTGKQAIDYSGGVSAEDNFGIGGYGRIMGPNGEAQYWAPSLPAACGVLFDHYDLTYRAPGERWPRRADDARSRRSRRPVGAATGRGRRLHDGRRHLLRRRQPRPQEALRHPHPDGRRHRPGPRPARTLAGDGRSGDGRGLRRPARGTGRDADRHGVAAPAAPRRHARRRAGAVVGGHAVPAVVEEGGAGDQRGQRLPSRGDAGQPVGVRRLTGVAATAAARVRRRDRPGDRQLRRPVRAVRRVPLPRRSVRRVLGHPQRRHGGAGRRGLLRVGDRWSAGGRRRVHPRGRRPHPRR